VRLNLSLIQLNIREDGDKNLERALKLIKGTILQGDFFILPELFITNYSKIEENIVERKHPLFTLFEELSKKYPQKYFLTGSIPFKRDGNTYNSSFLFKDGKTFHLYDKIHLFTPMGEREIFESGNILNTYRIKGKNFQLKMGVIICYDLRFPELTRILAKSGIDILFVPAQWPLSRIEVFKNLIIARASENGIFVAGINRVGRDGEELFGGSSLVVSPTGEILNPLTFEEKVIHVSINPEKYRKFKEKIDPLKDIEERIYDLKPKIKICEKKLW